MRETLIWNSFAVDEIEAIANTQKGRVVTIDGGQFDRRWLRALLREARKTLKHRQHFIIK